MKPNGASRGDLDSALSLTVPGQRQAYPEGIGTIDELLRSGQALAFLTWPTPARVRWSGLVQGRIQAQARDNRHRLPQRRAGVQKLQGRIRAVGDHHQTTLGQPT